MKYNVKFYLNSGLVYEMETDEYRNYQKILKKKSDVLQITLKKNGVKYIPVSNIQLLEVKENDTLKREERQNEQPT